jgi:diketogulonate reductase-like aldo/keto reductase
MFEERPRIGLGTYRLKGEACARAVATAIEAGYRHLDSARLYGNEAAVAEGHARGCEQAGIDRDEVLVATKLWSDELGYDDAVAAARESRDRLETDAIGLLYVHWPTNTFEPAETLRALDDVVADGVADRVGVSNFSPALLEEAVDRLSAPVAAHQVEMHPLLQQERLHELALEDGHWLVAYAPVARGGLGDVPEVRAVADRHDATPEQIALAWLHSKERVVPIPKSGTPAHIRENVAALSLDLAAEDIRRIDAIPESRYRRLVDLAGAPWNRR